MRKMFSILNVGLVCLLSCAAVWAQATAQINGTARDQSGAVLPGVEITATQTDTGISRMTITNETGSFILPNLALGPYRLEASLPGFRTFAQSGIVLQVNSNPVINVVMEVGQVTETIEVQANAAMVETRAAGVGQLTEQERILELPLNGRNVQDLVALTGAAVQLGDSTERFFPGTPYVSLGGAPQGFGVDYLLDGAPHLNFATGISMPMPFPDATQEFTVETSGLGATRGRASSVGAVTKSGTNAFHGDAFWFVRNDLFNARQYFAATNSTLKRNQFGGTISGPIIRNRLFFFGGYQGTTLRQDPADVRSFIPTAAMLAGDFTAFASPACQGGRQITLRAPFVNNRIDPSQFSPAARNLANRLVTNAPTPLNPCGEVQYGSRSKENQGQYSGKIDFQWTAKHSLFGRVLYGVIDNTGPFQLSDGNLLLSNTNSYDNTAQSWALGSTYLISANMVNSFRLSVNRTDNRRIGSLMGFNYCDVGVKMYCGWHATHIGTLNVTGGFSIGQQTGSGAKDNTYRPTAYQINNDISLVRGTHQIAFGGNVTHGRFNSYNSFASAAQVAADGNVTGLGMADFMIGRTSRFFMGAPNPHNVKQTFFSLYGADAWRVTPRVTLNYGMRWEPYLPQTIVSGFVYTFDVDRFRQGIKTTVYPNAPSGFIYPGDSGFPGKKGINNQWAHFTPRVGMGWDVNGDGKTSVRASYAYSYAFVSGDWRDTYNGHPPFGNRITIDNPAGGFDDPWRGVPGGDPFPYALDANVRFPANGIFIRVPYDLQTPITQSWNLSMQRQVAADWLLSASYIGTKTTHLWLLKTINPAVYFPGTFNANGTCTAQGYTLRGTAGATCSTTGNTQARRVFSLERPADGQLMSHVSEMDAGGTQNYHGMLLTVQRRAARGLTLNTNYTLSHCIGPEATLEAMGPHTDRGGYKDPTNRDFDRGNCDADRRHILNFTAVAETPQFANRTLRLLATDWRLAGIYRWSSGSPLTIAAGSDRSLNGVPGQRADQLVQDPFGDRSAAPLSRYLKPEAFALPAIGTLGNVGRNSIAGPAQWSFDLSLSRGFRVREEQRLEFRAEAYNVTNSFRPLNPAVSVGNLRTFGEIRESRDPRILQFALKYIF